MFDISFGEFLLIMAVAMAFLGPERIPEAARALGKGVRRLRDAFTQVRDEMTADEQTAQAFSEMQETMQEIAQAVNVRHVVRELSEPLLASHLVQETPAETNATDAAAHAEMENVSSPLEMTASPANELPAQCHTTAPPPPQEGELSTVPSSRIKKTFHPAPANEDSDSSP